MKHVIQFDSEEELLRWLDRLLMLSHFELQQHGSERVMHVTFPPGVTGFDGIDVRFHSPGGEDGVITEWGNKYETSSKAESNDQPPDDRA